MSQEVKGVGLEGYPTLHSQCSLYSKPNISLQAMCPNGEGGVGETVAYESTEYDKLLVSSILFSQVFTVIPVSLLL